MTLVDQANLLRDTIAEWAREHGGTARIASDPIALLDILQLKPGSLTVALMFESESPSDTTDGLDILGYTTRSWKAVLSRGRTLKLDSDDTLITGAAGGAPLFVLVEELRETIRTCSFASQPTCPEPFPSYLGISRTNIDGYLLDAYEVRFSIPTRIPDHHDA